MKTSHVYYRKFGKHRKCKEESKSKYNFAPKENYRRFGFPSDLFLTHFNTTDYTICTVLNSAFCTCFTNISLCHLKFFLTSIICNGHMEFHIQMYQNPLNYSTDSGH